MTDLQRRIARARLLRREGKTYAEIRAVVGDVGDDRLATWLAGIPRPPQTRRGGPPLVEQRQRARAMRMGGATYDEIVAALGVSRGSLSAWLRDLPVPARVRQRRVEHLRRVAAHGGRRRRAACASRSERRRTIARRAVTSMSERDLFMTGLALYWAEGAKDKPWRRDGRVTLTNSDPDVLRVFLAWLDLLGIRADERTYRLSIHETADVAAEQRWWCDAVGIPWSSFRAPMLKRHNPKPRRHNVGAGYHGCLVVTVARGAALYDAIEGWWHGVADGFASGCAAPGRVPSGASDPGSSNGRTLGFGPSYGGSSPPPGASGEPNPWSPPRWWEAVPPVGSVATVAADPAEPA